MSLTWFEEYAKIADATEAKRKEEWNANVVKLPVPGEDVQVAVRLKEPTQRTITSEKKKKSFVIYVYETTEGKKLEGFENLHFAIVRALAKKAELIKAKELTDLLLHIQNVGQGTKDKWVVVPLVGV